MSSPRRNKGAFLTFSDRSAWPQTQNPLAALLDSKRRDSQKIIDLGSANPTLCGFNYLKNPLFQNLNHPDNARYSPDARGLLSARQAVAAYYADKGVQMEPDQIFLTASTSEAYSFLFRLLGNPGDTVLAHSPGYPLFDYLAELNDLKLEKYSLTYEKTWRLVEKSLEPFSKKNPKALIWVNPNNPTGNYASDDEIKTLNHFSVKNSCPLIVDEVFFDFSWNKNKKYKSFAGNGEALTFTLSGISKILGLPQMKLSWIVVSGPAAFRREACARLEVIADTYLSVNAPVQNALPAWLGGREMVITEILSRIETNLKNLLEITRASAKFKVLDSQGGWYAVLHLNGGVDEDFCLKLLNDKNILVHPGYLFDFEEENILVVSLLASEPEFSKGIKGLIDG